MATQVQFRGGTSTAHDTFDGVAKEVTVDTSINTLVVHDGTATGNNGAGQYPLFRASGGAQSISTTGDISAADGTFTGDVDIADKIVHTGDTNTAIRFPSADTFTVETGGTEAMRINSSGSLLIGPAGAAATTITSAGAATFAGQLSVGGVNTTSATTAGFEVTTAGRVTSQTSGSGSSNDSAWRGFYGTTKTSEIFADGDATFAGNINTGGSAWNGAADGGILYSNGTTAFTSDQNTYGLWRGYTTGSSTVTSEIFASGVATFASTVQSKGNPMSGTAGGSQLAGDSGVIACSPDGNNTQAIWRGFEYGTTAATSSILGTGKGYFAETTTIGDSDLSGSVTTSKGVQLQKGGTVFAQSPTGTDSLWLGYEAGSQKSKITAAGAATFSSTVTCTSLTETSDQRFKKNITDANPQLADVTALGGKLRNWDWSDEAPVYEKDTRFLGLVAQEVESICPGIIHTVPRTKDGPTELTAESTDEDGNVTSATYEQVDDSYKTIKTSVLIMKLLGAVTELSAKVAALEAA